MVKFTKTINIVNDEGITVEIACGNCGEFLIENPLVCETCGENLYSQLNEYLTWTEYNNKFTEEI